MRRGVIVLAAIVSLCSALPSPRDDKGDIQNLLADAPGFALKDFTSSTPDDDGFLKADVVNVNKRVIVFVRSSQTEEGARRRALIRDTWLQPLNRTSPQSFTKDHRRAISVWFVVPRDPSRPVDNQTVTAEGQLNGDITIIASKNSDSVAPHSPSLLEEVGAILRWIHVAYYQRFDFVLFTEDDAFVSLGRLETLCGSLLGSHSNGGEVLIYAGFVNSFELAPESYHHKYFAPFVQSGTILMSRAVTELIARELGQVTTFPRFDATIGHFLVPFSDGKPTHIDKFVPNIKNTYEDVVDPVLVLGADEETMKTLNSGMPLPGFHKEMETRGIFIHPFPKDDQPECHGIAGEGCDFPNLRMVDAEK
jgi:hypothetical protein